MARLVLLPLAGALLAVAGSGRDEGLVLFRTPDAQGRACSTCHSPDGIELVAYSFDRATIVRRATPHLGPARAERITDYLLAVRAARKGPKFDPMRDRPLQPGGFVLPGETSAERDAALEPSLRRLLPTLCGSPIQTYVEAQKAIGEVRALDLATLPIGVPFDRLSEDEFHGREHALIGDWFADVPSGDADRIRPLEEAYLAQPSDANLEALEAEIERHDGRFTFGEELAKAKREALLLLTHRLRTGRQGLPGGIANPAARVVESWFHFARNQVDPMVDARKSTFKPLDQQRQDAMASWGWLALIFDPTLKGNPGVVFWASDGLTRAGYPLHHVLFNLVRVATRYFDSPQSFREEAEPRFGYLTLAKPFVAKGEFCRGFAANALRMGARLSDSRRDPADIEREIARFGLPTASQTRLLRRGTAIPDAS